MKVTVEGYFSGRVEMERLEHDEIAAVGALIAGYFGRREKDRVQRHNEFEARLAAENEKRLPK